MTTTQARAKKIWAPNGLRPTGALRSAFACALIFTSAQSYAAAVTIDIGTVNSNTFLGTLFVQPYTEAFISGTSDFDQPTPGSTVNQLYVGSMNSPWQVDFTFSLQQPYVLNGAGALGIAPSTPASNALAFSILNNGTPTGSANLFSNINGNSINYQFAGPVTLSPGTIDFRLSGLAPASNTLFQVQGNFELAKADPPAAVPISGTALLMASGIGVLGVVGRRRTSRPVPGRPATV